MVKDHHVDLYKITNQNYSLSPMKLSRVLALIAPEKSGLHFIDGQRYTAKCYSYCLKDANTRLNTSLAVIRFRDGN